MHKFKINYHFDTEKWSIMKRYPFNVYREKMSQLTKKEVLYFWNILICPDYDKHNFWERGCLTCKTKRGNW